MTKYLYIACYCIAVLSVIIFSLVFRPFSSPDEGAHFLRAYEVSNGHFINTEGNVGQKISYNDYNVIAKKYNPIAYYQSECDPQFEGCSVLSVNSAGAYPPIAYAFLSPSLIIGDVFNLTIENKLRLGRLMNALFCLSIAFFFAYKYSKENSIFIMFIMIPMVLILFSSFSADGVTILLSLLVILISYHHSFKEKKMLNIYILLILAFLVGSTKYVYIITCGLPFIFLICEHIKNKSKLDYKEFSYTLLIASTAILTSIFWMAITDTSLVYLGNGANPVAQLTYVLHNPLEYVYISQKAWLYDFMTLVSTFVPKYYFMGKSTTLILGCTTMVMIFIVLITDNELIANKINKLIIFVFFVMSSLFIILPLYLTYTPVGYDIILGVQQRYILPLLPILMIALSGIVKCKFSFNLAVSRIAILSVSVINLYICYFLL